MSDQEGAAQPARDERAPQTSRQTERGGGSSGGGGGAQPQQRERDRGRRRHGQQQQGQPRRSEQQLPMDELRDLFGLFTEHGLTEFEIEREGFRVHLGRNPSPQVLSSPQGAPLHVAPVPSPAPQPAASGGQQSAALEAQAADAQAEASAKEEESLHVIVSPIVGTFYRSPSPTAEPFIRLGSHVDPDTVVCIIEAMKLMNEIQAETTGEIAKIYVENGQPVEFGQPLFGVKKM